MMAPSFEEDAKFYDLLRLHNNHTGDYKDITVRLLQHGHEPYQVLQLLLELTVVEIEAKLPNVPHVSIGSLSLPQFKALSLYQDRGLTSKQFTQNNWHANADVSSTDEHDIIPSHQTKVPSNINHDLNVLQTMKRREVDPIVGVKLLQDMSPLQATSLSEELSINEVTSLTPQQCSMMLEYHQLKNQHPQTRLTMSAVLDSHWFRGKHASPFHLKSCFILFNRLDISVSEILASHDQLSSIQTMYLCYGLCYENVVEFTDSTHLSTLLQYRELGVDPALLREHPWYKSDIHLKGLEHLLNIVKLSPYRAFSLLELYKNIPDGILVQSIFKHTDASLSGADRITEKDILLLSDIRLSILLGCKSHGMDMSDIRYCALPIFLNAKDGCHDPKLAKFIEIFCDTWKYLTASEYFKVIHP